MESILIVKWNLLLLYRNYRHAIMDMYIKNAVNLRCYEVKVQSSIANKVQVNILQ